MDPYELIETRSIFGNQESDIELDMQAEIWAEWLLWQSENAQILYCGNEEKDQDCYYL